MKTNISKRILKNRALALLISAAVASVTWRSAAGHEEREEKFDQYTQSNLVSDLAGIALLQDTNLVNAWGISFGPQTPFWISANGTGKALIYTVTNDLSGQATVTKAGLEVAIPGDGTPTGQVFNDTPGFNGDLFIFASEDGTISGWRGSLGTAAEVLTNFPGAVYKGITLTTNESGPLLLAANFAAGTVDAFDSDMNLVGQFADSNAPAGYAPFNVQSVAGFIFVTYAVQDADKHDDVAGRGHGLIDILDPDTGTFHRFATGSNAGGKLREIDSPWGITLAPSSFGMHSDRLLVGNFGNGTIMTFEANGRFKGLLENRHDRPLVIDGLWALTVGNGVKAGETNIVYFTAGPDGESHGLFGSIEPVRKHGRDR